MSIFSWFQTKVATVEADVLNSIVSIKKGIAMTEAEAVAGLTWVNAHKAQIAAAAQEVAAIVASLAAAGVGVPPVIIQDINLALTGVGALVNVQPGATDAETLVNSYVALKNAYTSLNTATISLVQLPQQKT